MSTNAGDTPVITELETETPTPVEGGGTDTAVAEKPKRTRAKKAPALAADTPQSPPAGRRGRKVTQFAHDTRTARSTGAKVQLFATDHPENNGQFQTGEGKAWAVHCHMHSQTGYAGNVAEAFRALSKPEEFCTECAAIVKNGGPPRAASASRTVMLEYSLPGAVAHHLSEIEGLRVEERKVGSGMVLDVKAGRRASKAALKVLQIKATDATGAAKRPINTAVERILNALTA